MRELSDWLTGYIKYTENSEPPLSYHTWCGIGVIAGALQRKCWLEWGFEIIYPNMYVVLVGPSGRTRKGTALRIAREILNEVPGVTLASQSVTREALIGAMKRSINNFPDPDGVIHFHCSMTCFSEELSVFLGENDIKFLASLTDWYDSHRKWEYETIGRGLDSIQGVCFNLIGATAPEWLQTMLPQEAVGGGFTSRVIFVVEEQKRRSVPKHILTETEKNIQKALVRDLERISQLCGPFTFDGDGESAYTSWYEGEDAKMAKGNFPIDDPRMASYADRRASHLRKLMMVMSASRGDDMKLGKGDFDRALSVLTTAERKMHKTFGGLGQSRYSAVTEKVMQHIQSMGTVTRSSLMQKFYRDVDSQSLKIIEDLMEMTHLVEIKHSPMTSEKIYIWKGKK